LKSNTDSISDSEMIEDPEFIECQNSGISAINKCLPGLNGHELLGTHLYSFIKTPRLISKYHIEYNQHLDKYFTAYENFFVEYKLSEAIVRYNNINNVFSGWWCCPLDRDNVIDKTIPYCLTLQRNNSPLAEDAFRCIEMYEPVYLCEKKTPEEIERFNRKFSQYVVACENLC